MQIRTHIDNNGRILIPSQLRKELNLKSGDTLVMRRINNELRLISLATVIKKIQADFKKLSNSKKSAVDEFIKARKEENKLEENKMEKLGKKNAY